MCYSGRCLFENHMGDCQYEWAEPDVKRLIARLNVTECFAGGAPEDDSRQRLQCALTAVIAGRREPLDVDQVITTLLGP